MGSGLRHRGLYAKQFWHIVPILVWPLMVMPTGFRWSMPKATLYDGDQLLYAIVLNRAKHGIVSGVVGTLMTNLALEHALAKMDIPFARAAVGDRYVVEMLHDKRLVVSVARTRAIFLRSIAIPPATVWLQPSRCWPPCAKPAES
jgi:hypothetical protein